MKIDAANVVVNLCANLDMLKVILLLSAVALAPAVDGADKATAPNSWPARVFAPYMYVGSGDNFKLTECDDACGQKFYTLAFIISDRSNNPAWDGRIPVDQNFYADQIAAIRARGGDVIMSFGGEAGKDIAIVETNPATLETKYQSVVDRYHFTWLDFDIEGKSLEDSAANRRRNTALVWLQAKNPGLIISYTLPVNPHGLSEDAQKLLADAKAKGLKIHSADLMVMYFGKEFIHKGKSEGELGIDSANVAHAQIQKIDPAIRIGLCPCLGRNGSQDEVFTLEDARTLKAFADRTPWICSLHFWSINKDAARPRRKRIANTATNEASVAGFNTNRVATPGAQQPWAFAKIFQIFAAR